MNDFPADPYRVLYNQDCTNLFAVTKEPLTPAHVDRMVDEVAAREAWVAQMKRLADQGCDYLARALARCRARGMAPGVSIRMNDMHDAPTPGTHLFDRFYMEHPECRLDPPVPGAGWAAKGLDFAHPKVRELKGLRERRRQSR